MDLSDYLQLVRRAWRSITGAAILGLALAALYLLVTPKEFEATASLLVVAEDSNSITDAAAAAQFGQSSVNTFAAIVGSAAVLGPAAAELNPSPTVAQLRGQTSVVARSETAIIDVKVSGSDSVAVSQAANAIASTASTAVPALQSDLASSPIRLKVIERATPPQTPTAPSTRGVLVIGVVLGLAGGLVAALTRQALDRRLRLPEDIRRATTAPVLALLPRTRRGIRTGVAVRDDPAGSVGEAFRSLRTTVGTFDTDGRRCILVAPVAEDRDGAFVAVNLGWSIAQGGRSVLVVDVDLRASSVADLLGGPPVPGLADFLERKVALSQVVRPTGHERLYYISSGTKSTRSPADLLSSNVLSESIAALGKEFEYLILHAPPVLAFTDAAVVSRVATQTVVVASSARTTAEQLSAAVEGLGNVKVDAAGVILTDALGADRANRRLRVFRDRSRSDGASADSEASAIARDLSDDIFRVER